MGLPLVRRRWTVLRNSQLFLICLDKTCQTARRRDFRESRGLVHGLMGHRQIGGLRVHSVQIHNICHYFLSLQYG